MGIIDWECLPLSRAATGRAALRRTEPDVVRTVLTEPGTQVLLVHQGRLLIDGTRSETDCRLALIPADALDPALSATLRGPSTIAVVGDSRCTWLFLGSDDNGSYLACILPDAAGSATLGLEGIIPVGPADALVESGTWESLRVLGAGLHPRDVGLATEAVALAGWHAAHPRCPRCGEPTEPVAGGWVRRCTNDDTEHHPRTDAAVIMAVLDDKDRLLLGHGAQWPEGRFSTLAGFVEPGESVEAAVRREVLEEVGVAVGAVAYRGSQPWPFPASLMLGFVARATSTEIAVDTEEVTDARWFSRTELSDAVAAGEVQLPTRASIARSLIEDWYGTELPGGW